MFRVLHLGKFFPPFSGGIEHFLVDLMTEQQQQGITVAAIVHDHHLHFNRFFTAISPEKWQDLLIYRVPSYGRLLYAPVSPHFPLWLQKVLQQFKPNLLHLHLPNTSAFFALWSAQAQHIPLVIHWHADVISTIDSRLSYAYPLYRPFEQQLLARSKAIVVTSPPYLATSTALKNWHNKCHIVPLGLSLKRLPQPHSSAIAWAQQQWQYSEKMRILSVGRLTYYKGHEGLIQAMTYLEGAQALIVGEGEQRPFLENLIKELNLSKKVKLLGHCSNEQLAALFTTCDCFCLTSLERTEAFGMVLLEAMRYAKPIVASNIAGSGVTWVVQEGVTGRLVPLQNLPALVQILHELIHSAELRHHLGKSGYQRFFEQFSIEQVAIGIEAVYRKIFSSIP